MLCAKRCPSDAIEGKRKEPHIILQEDCIKCGVCRDVCPEDAVIVE
jgi:Fe-S-cluster-containing hydrogenase component 2